MIHFSSSDPESSCKINTFFLKTLSFSNLIGFNNQKSAKNKEFKNFYLKKALTVYLNGRFYLSTDTFKRSLSISQKATLNLFQTR